MIGPLVFVAVGVLGLWTAGAFLGYPDGWAKPLIVAIEVALLPTLVLVLALLMNGARRAAGARSVSVETLFALLRCALVGIGLYGLIVQPHPLRKLVAFNIMGSGVFVLFGALAKRGAAAGLAADPVPQALLITAIVVAFAATAVTVALLLRLIEATDSASLADEPPAGGQALGTGGGLLDAPTAARCWRPPCCCPSSACCSAWCWAGAGCSAWPSC